MYDLRRHHMKLKGLNLGAELMAILDDKQKGSTAIALDALTLIQKKVPLTSSDFAIFLRIIGTRRPEMVVLRNIAEIGTIMLRNNSEPSTICRIITNELKRSVSEASSNGARLITETTAFLTLSNSEQLVSFFLSIQDRVFRVYVLECEPFLESRLLVKSLVDHGIRAEAISASRIWLALRRVNCFVSGSDSIGRYAFLNRSGTSEVAKATRAKGIPFYVLTTKWKLEPNIGAFQRRSSDGIFESIPNKLVTKFVTDVGNLNSSSVHHKLSFALKAFIKSEN
jgi:translation initiation factor 2B subunit (eIF-2B alpha/beta/delta family)